MIAKSKWSRKWHHVLAGGPETGAATMWCGRVFWKGATRYMVPPESGSLTLDAIPSSKYCKICTKLRLHHTKEGVGYVAHTHG